MKLLAIYLTAANSLMLLIAVHLYAHEGNITALRSFEQEALTLVRQFGGELLAAFKPANPDNSADIPDEIHLLQFPSQATFDAYRQSPESAALADRRIVAIRKSVVFLSEEIVAYKMSDYHINIFYSEEDDGYIADIPDLDACSAFGETPFQALQELEIAKSAWLEAARAEGKPIPPPKYRPVIYQMPVA